MQVTPCYGALVLQKTENILFNIEIDNISIALKTDRIQLD